MPAPSHNGSQTRLYRCWQSMKHRIKHRPSYRARGVDPAWLVWENFRDWALQNGYEDGLTLDRIDNDIGYWADNCRWVTHIDQQRNKTKTLRMTIYGETKSIADWAEDSRCKVSYRILIRRYYQNWEPEKALTYSPGYAKKLMSRSDNRLSSVVNPTGKLPASLPVEGQSA